MFSPLSLPLPPPPFPAPPPAPPSSLLPPTLSFQDEAYDHFAKHGVFPTLSHPWPASHSRILWGLRVNQVFWSTLLLSPLVYLALSLSWTALVWLFGGLLTGSYDSLAQKYCSLSLVKPGWIG